MDKKVVFGACLVGVISILVYCLALMFGINYNELIGVTIIQIAYVIVLSIYFIVCLVKKIKSEMELEKVPVTVEKEYEEENIIDYDQY